MRKLLKIAVAASPLALAACAELDVTNPNAPTQETIVASPEGLINIGVGVQLRFGASTAAFIYGAGLISDEFGPLNTAFETISDAERGVVTTTAGFVADIWNSEYRTIKSANDIIFNHQQVEFPQGMRSGLLSLAYLLKAAAIGELVQTFQQVAIDTYDDPQPQLVDRATALTFALELLDSAAVAYADSGSDTHAAFNTQVKANGFDIPNTIAAYEARFRRMRNNDWTEALNAADAVSRTVFSVIPYSTTTTNPIFAVTSGSSGIAPLDAFRTSDPAEAQRTAYHVTAANVTGRAPLQSPLDAFARYSDRTAPIPAFYPDEVLLIKAEALVNLGRLAEARAVVDSVRTDCPGQGRVTTDPGPCLTPYAGVGAATDLLAEIYRNRRYELFATGLRWEDLRRLMPAAAGNPLERCWFPYPQTERDANPANIPAPDVPEPFEPSATPRQCLQ